MTSLFFELWKALGSKSRINRPFLRLLLYTCLLLWFLYGALSTIL